MRPAPSSVSRIRVLRHPGGPVTRLIATAGSLVLSAVLVFPPAATMAAEPTERSIDDAIEARAPYGLGIDRSQVRSMLADGKDVGSKDWGIPMTAAEAKQLDLSGRMRFADQVDRNVMPYVESLPTFAGAYIDQKDGGGLVVMLTERSANTTAGIDARMPNDTLGRRIVTADTPFAQLERALERVDAVSQSVVPGAVYVGAGIDTQGNRLRVSFTPDTIEQATAKRDELASRLGVTIRLTVAEQGHDTEMCGNGNSRGNCWNPIRAGVVIHLQQLGGTPCTMGFHITMPNGDKEWLTAGHCGYDTTPNAHQYHSPAFHGGERIGVRTATLYNTTHHRDIMRVSHRYGSEISSRIYDTNTPYAMAAAGSVMAGETVCASLGISDDNKCRVVVEVQTSWQSETFNPGTLKVFGASSMIPVDFGDSGAPVYRKFLVSPPGVWRYTPLGLINHEPIDGRPANSYFAKIEYALDEWGATIYSAQP